MSDLMELNHAHWDEVTPIHVASPFYRIAAFRRGEMVLDPIAVEGVADVAGKRLLHLQCHIGLDTLSLARLGAEVTGLDFSRPAIEAARTLAAETGIPGVFVESNVLDPPANLTGFDIVFASWGAICWIPDIAAWMRVAAGALKPGGRLVLIDGHPALLMISGDAETPYAIGYPYDSETPVFHQGAGDYAEPTATIAADRTVEWQHGIGRIINGAIDAGFVIRRFDELDRVPWCALAPMQPVDQDYWALPAGAPSFPLAFRLLAEKV